MRRALVVWVVLFAAYTATIGLHAFGRSDYGGDEPYHLLAAESLAEDGNIDVLDDFRERSYDDFYPYPLDMRGRLTEGALHEPTGTGLPLVLAPAFAIGGAKGAELLLAAIGALAGALAYLLALRVTPDPWALGATMAVGLSPPLVAYGSAVYPDLPAGAALTGATLLALKLDERVRRRYAFGCFVLLGLLPWLGPKFLPAAVIVGWFAVRRIRAARRGLLAIASVEVALFSLAMYVGLSEALYGGPTPYSANPPGSSATGADSAADYLERAYRAVALWIDRDYGLLRWSPVLLLGALGGWLFLRARREHLDRVLPEHGRAQAAAGLCCALVATQFLVAVFLAPTMFGFWFPGRHLVAALPLTVPLVAWGLRHAPRVGGALALLGLAGSLWVVLDDGGLAAGRPDAPWGPLVDVFPRFDGDTGAYLVAGLVALAAGALVALDARRWRRLGLRG